MRRPTAEASFRQPAARLGRANLMWLLAVVGLALVGMMTALLTRGGHVAGSNAQTLTMYTAAGLRSPVEAIAEQYQQDYGTKIHLQFGGSNTLLNQLQVNKYETADLFLAADDAYTDQAVERGLARETLPIGHQRPVLVVRRDQKKHIASLKDLLREDVVVGMASPDQAAIGKAVKQALERATVDDTNLWAQLEAAVTERGVFKPTVTDVANDVKLGAVDAGIIWDTTLAMAKYRDELIAVEAPELESEPDLVSVAVLNSSRQPTAALRFARYLTSRDKGLTVFRDFGMRPVEGDVWEEHPQINFYCGAVNRRVVENIVAEFQQREGIDVNTIYDGCGILTSRMKTIDGQKTALGFPDMYMACDVYYLDNVRDWFQEAANVSDVEIVIAVPKGSHKVQTSDDLLKPGVRVAIGQPEQCTIGALTRRMLEQDGVYKKLLEKQQQPGEVVVEKSSSSLLVPDVVTGHVDAAVAYITDVLPNLNDVDLIKFNSPLNVAIQPLSIATSSEHKYLVRRLYRRIVASPEAFEAAGFHYRLAKESATSASKGALP